MRIGHGGRSATAAVFVHGMLGRAEIMEPMSRPLSDAGVRTTLLELEGARRYWSGIGAETWRRWIEQAVGGIAGARESAEQVFAVGVFGGALVAAVAASRTGVDGLVLLCPPLAVETPRAFLPRRGALLEAVSRLGIGRRRGRRQAEDVAQAAGLQSSGGNGSSIELRTDTVPRFPDGDTMPAMVLLEGNLQALQEACREALGDVRSPVLIGYPRRGGLSPEGSMELAYESLKSAKARELLWLESPEDVYDRPAAERVYRFVSRYCEALPPAAVDVDRSRLEIAARALEPKITAAVQHAVDVGETGPCQVAAFLVTGWLLDEGYDAFMVGAECGRGSTDVPDHYWTEVCLGREWYVVDFLSYGPFDVRPMISPRETALKDGYVGGRHIELRLPSVRRKIAAEIGAFNPGIGQYLRELR